MFGECKNSRRLFRVSLAVAALLVWMGCGERCSDPPQEEGVEGARALAEVVPPEAKAVVLSDELAVLMEGVQAVVEALPVDAEGPGAKAQWERAGAKMDAPAVAFWGGDQWVVVGWVDPEREVSLADWPGEGSAERRQVGAEEGEGWKWRDDDGGWTQWVATDGRRIAAGWPLDEEARAMDESIWIRNQGRRWKVEAPRLQIDDAGESPDGSSDGEVVAYGAIDGAQMMERLPGGGRAEEMVHNLGDGLGMVHWSLTPREDGRWTIVVETSGDAGEEERDLGEARKPLPTMGGLLRRGSPGVIRLSADPERVMELFRDNLDPSERQEFDAMLQMLEEQLSVDLHADVIANFTGQVAIVVLGFEEQFFELEGMERLASLIRLSTTRGAVVVPFEDREAMQRVLDVFTQLTMGNLRRQATERTIQYAWFDDAILKWAAILDDEQLIFVDSAVAFDHVGDWERSPSPLDESFVERGVDSMLEKTRGLGGYVDVATVRSLVREAGDEELEAWLEPLEAIRVVTDVDGQGDRATIDIWTVHPAGAGEE